MHGCGHDAVLAVNVLVSTSGARVGRKQKLSQSVRLCMVDARELANGVLPAALAAAIKDAITNLTGDECKPLEKKQPVPISKPTNK